MQKLLIVAFVAIFCVSSIEGLKCYQCLGKDDCKSPRQVECKENINGCASAETSIAPYVFRDCASDEDGNDFGLNGCINTVYQGQKARLCECRDGDLCNDHYIGVPNNAKNIFVGRYQMAVQAKAQNAWMALTNKY